MVRKGSLYNSVVWSDIWQKHTPLFHLICFTSMLPSLSHFPKWNGVWLQFLRVFFTDWTLFSRLPPLVSPVVLGRSSEQLLCKCHFLTGQASCHLLCTRDVFKGVRLCRLYLKPYKVMLSDIKKIIFFVFFFLLLFPITPQPYKYISGMPSNTVNYSVQKFLNSTL